MCRACEEEALYQAYLDALAKKEAEAAASASAPRDPVCEDLKLRAVRETGAKQ